MAQTWKQERPSWCPHPDCVFVRRAMDAICVGHLPELVAHDGDFNHHRFCLNGASDSGGVFDLQVNNTDLWWFRQMFSALDGKAVEHTLAADVCPGCDGTGTSYPNGPEPEMCLRCDGTGHAAKA